MSGERVRIEEKGKGEKEMGKVKVIEFDWGFLKGRCVVVFDDVIRKGVSYGRYGNEVERVGGNVVGGILVGRRD